MLYDLESCFLEKQENSNVNSNNKVVLRNFFISIDF